MIALSIRQPWAWLIVHGHKDVENRDWPTRYRGETLIHAGKTKDKEQYAAAQEMAKEVGLELPPIDDLEYGGIVGRAYLHDCVSHSPSHWFIGEHGFLLRDSTPLPFTPCRGRLGFFNVPAGVIAGEKE